MKKKLYFGHSIIDYNKEIETKSIEIIKGFGFEVENPNQPHHSEGYKKGKMKYFLNEVLPKCDGMAFLPTERGITSGVASEISYFITKGLPVYLISREGNFDNIENIDYDCDVLDYNETVDYINEVMSR
jgi:nucleoside 2-deoxyribosyltransferase